MNALSGFTTILPIDIKQVPGVFVIARYIDKNSTRLEFLHCDESENIKTKATEVMMWKRFDGFEHPIVYLVRREDSQAKRIELLTALLNLGIPNK